MKIMYLTMALPDETSGVYKKIMAQVSAFVEFGHECRVFFVTDKEESKYYSNNGIQDIGFQEVLPIVSRYLEECDFCYARFELLRHKYYKRVLDICSEYKVKVVFEIPTFPPYQESVARGKSKLKDGNLFGAIKTFIGAWFVQRDMYKMARMARLVCIVADDYKFKGTKTIRIENGIDLCKNPYVEHLDTTEINIIAVSNFAVWNGYDRAIKGLKNYTEKNPKHKIRLIFVGPLENAPELRKMVNDYQLEKYITFTGALSGEKLDEQYAHSNIALGALGNHRRKVFANSSLKAKEYAARGMLMVLSDAEGIEKFILDRSFLVRSDETPIDFEAVVSWYESLAEKEKFRREIHGFAEANYSWSKQIEKILNNI